MEMIVIISFLIIIVILLSWLLWTSFKEPECLVAGRQFNNVSESIVCDNGIIDKVIHLKPIRLGPVHTTREYIPYTDEYQRAICGRCNKVKCNTCVRGETIGEPGTCNLCIKKENEDIIKIEGYDPTPSYLRSIDEPVYNDYFER